MTTIIYTWNAAQLDCYPEANGQTAVVFTVHWTLSGTDGTHSSRAYGSVGLPTPEGTLTPYADLTEPLVIGWACDALGAEAVASLEANVAAQIEAQINPPVVHPPVPWGPTFPERPYLVTNSPSDQ